MEKEKIFNFHTHIYPQKISTKAVKAIGDFYDIPMEMPGTAEALIEDGAEIGVTKYLISSGATTAHQVRSINDFLASEAEKHPEFVAFGSIHPDYEDIYGEVERMQKLGLCGMKIHPEFQKFAIDDESAFPIYEAVEGRFPILFHVGDDRYDTSSPKRLAHVLERYPKLQVIAAHFGGYREWDNNEVYLGHPRVWFDTSSSLMFITPDKAMEIIHRHGVSHILFGTDSPMWRHGEEWKRFNQLELTKEERKAVLWDNAVNLLGLNDNEGE